MMITLPIPLALFAFFLAFELGFVAMAILQYKADDRVAAMLAATAAKLATATADLDRARLSLAEYELALWQRDDEITELRAQLACHKRGLFVVKAGDGPPEVA